MIARKRKVGKNMCAYRNKIQWFCPSFVLGSVWTPYSSWVCRRLFVTWGPSQDLAFPRGLTIVSSSSPGHDKVLVILPFRGGGPEPIAGRRLSCQSSARRWWCTYACRENAPWLRPVRTARFPTARAIWRTTRTTSGHDWSRRSPPAKIRIHHIVQTSDLAWKK